MFLKRLELVGFKSFAARTTAELPPGIVAVVGPNGSGKSNLADGVRWVLGEQSARAVRARKPEEVIFAGSAARQPLGMAEVSLILDNTDDALPIEYAEVRVTRRLYRSGDSEYLLNGARVRLKDITQLLLHAGLGPDTYSVIGQGSVDELILQRPDERRAAFENAADIRRHQLRLADARARLTATESNLLRVQDVIAELAPHVRRLKGQAERAARAETQRAELHELLVRYYRARLWQARAEQQAVEAALQRTTAAAQAAEADTLAAEQGLASSESALSGLDQQLAALRPRAEAYREQARAAERSLAVIRERSAGLAEQQATAEAELARLSEQIEQLTLEAAAQRPAAPGEEPEAEQALAERRARLAELQPALAAAQAERDAALRQRDQAERRTREAEARALRAEEELHALEASLALEQARQADRQARLAGLESELADLRHECAEVGQRLEQARSRLSASVQTRRPLSVRLEEVREALRTASQQADRLHGALTTLGAGWLSPNGADGQGGGLPESWRAALEGLPVVGVAAELAPRVRPIDRLLRGYLARTVVLPDDRAASEAHRRLRQTLPPDAPAWAVLSLDGTLLTANGRRSIEPLSLEHNGSTLADWRRQVGELEAERAQAEQARQAADAELAATRAALESAERDERAARTVVSDLEAQLQQLRRAEQAASSQLARLRAEQDRASRAAHQRADACSHASQAAETAHAQLATARSEREAAAERFSAAEQRLASVLEATSQARAELAAVETAHAQRLAEHQARAALQARIQAELESARVDRQTSSQRLIQLGAQRRELAEREAQLVEELQRTLHALAPIDKQLVQVETCRSELLAERRALEQRLAQLRASERSAHQAREEWHVRAQRAADELERLQAEIAEAAELEAEFQSASSWAEQLSLDLGGAPEADIDLEASRRRIANLQRELRAVGGVAESVVEEYRDLSQRHDFLVQQSEDLRAAMAELREAADELETSMRERFSSVFRATQEAFQDCFSTLFGGGEARLVLTAPDDVLRTGIDIVARPPGKKLQGLLSLSGGERALTIVALLFGLLKVNPTPFCVLDEVDAALDEANVQRFANLLAEFARRIQFIVVTHNRATMEKADAMYGVSMDTQGVSRLFSVEPRAVATTSSSSSSSSP